MSQYALKMSDEQAKEMPMVDLAFELLKAANTPFYYRDLMAEIAKIKGLSDDDVMQVIAQLYTEINIDGRFACVGTNLWGLKRWYPVEKSEDTVGGGKRPRIINDDDDDLDDEELYAEEEEETYVGEEDEFDNFDSNREDYEVEEAEEEGEFLETEETEEEGIGEDAIDGDEADEFGEGEGEEASDEEDDEDDDK